MSTRPLSVALPLLAAWLVAAAAPGATFTVTSTNDANDGTCNASHCSLREAILAANAAAGTDTISFASLTAAPPQVIAPTSALPSITGTVNLDGTTTPWYTSTPIVQIAGNSAGAGVNGLTLAAGSNGSTVRGLIVRNFGGSGIVVASNSNVLTRLWIGLDATGSGAAGNGGAGLAVSGSSNALGQSTYDNRLVVGANGGGGVVLTGGSNTLEFCFIGTAYGGTIARGNTGAGVRISGASATNNTLRQNVIAANTGDGLRIEAGASGNSMETNNLVGLDATGATAMGNGGSGVAVDSSSNNFIGKPGLGNIISANAVHGVAITGSSGNSGNTIRGNYIGTNLAGTATFGNGQTGVFLHDGSANSVGGPVTGNGNLVSGNGSAGIAVVGGSGHFVQSNTVGTNPAGNVDWGNAGNGIQVQGSAGIRIGLDATGPGNLVSGNAGTGIHVSGSLSTSVLIAGNTVGTTQPGTSPVPNDGDGIALVDVTGATIGGDTSSEDNVVGGNGRHGVWISGGGGHSIQVNEIGADGTGTVAVANQGHGILIENSTNNTVWSSLLSGNAGDGIRISGGSGNTLTALVTGLAVNGLTAMPNGGNGLSIVDSSGNTVGLPVAGSGNTFSGNLGHGILISGAGATNNLVRNVLLGTNVPDNGVVGNGRWGVLVAGASNNTIGGTGADACRIRGNGRGGVGIRGGTGNRIRQNMISGNTGLGIDLDADGADPMDGATPNDTGDGDGGSNGLQNYPVITSATTTSVNYTLNSTPSTTFTIDVFGSPACDPSGWGEGATLIASTTATTNGSGGGTFNAAYATQPAGTVITLTATSPSGNSSEFSLCSTPPAASAPGESPDRQSLGAPLMLTKNAGNPANLNFTWGVGCATGVTGYALYQGTIGTWYGHDRFGGICNLNATSASNQPPAAGSTYYLVVPVSSTRTEEGSYGKTDAGVQIPRALDPCQANQDLGPCV